MKRNRIIALLLALVLVLGLAPAALAAQEDAYHDPAEHWLTANNRTNELDANAVVTHETFNCAVCEQPTTFTLFRTPEYTRDGKSALTRNVLYSDGTMVDGESIGAILDGTPGVDAYYTGYHWTKAVCETCGATGSNGGPFGFTLGKNVYNLYDCAAEFMEDLPETVTYEYADNRYHSKTTEGGEYCCFCYGTRHEENTALERHSMSTTVTPQLGHQRFAVTSACTLCDYSVSEYLAAKSVIANYYGVADGAPHTLTVTELSDAGVSAAIRYGNSAAACTLTSAPNYTEAGQYTVYYAITYTHGGESMTENGVAYVWLRDEANEEVDAPCEAGAHSFAHLDAVSASCLALGYDRYLCADCGVIEKRDFAAALGHAWQGALIREATCETDGKLLEICSRCGEAKVTNTPKGEHRYETYTVAAACTSPGYAVKECTVCGDRHITNITSALPHDYDAVVTPATCEAGGHTAHVCEGCGSSFVTDYTDALGHAWDRGRIVTTATCDGSGVTEYRCTRCDYHRLEGAAAGGHIPGDPATCTTAQTCTKCGVVLAVPTGHTESGWIIDRAATTDSEGSRHKECENCGLTLATEAIPKLYMTATTDARGEAIVGGYLVTVTDADTGNPVANAAVALNRDNTIAIRLPNSRLLDYANQTTVTVQLVKDSSPVSGLGLTLTDKNDNYCVGLTDRAGQLTVPGSSGQTNGDGSATVGYTDADGDSFTLTVRVEDYETGRPIEGATVSVGKTGNITVILPDGRDMGEDDRITVTVTDNRGGAREGVTVIVRDDLGNRETGETDKDGKLTVPAVFEESYHGAYIYGYPDGTFGPERNMTRSEAAAIFARLLSAKTGQRVSETSRTNFTDVPSDAWYSGYVKYLTGYGVALGYDDKTYRPDEPITRAEFTAMAVRFFDAYGDGDAEIMEQYADFNDVSDGYWAAGYIRDAALHGWVLGYGDGSFRGDAYITRAEIVTLVNRLLGREADADYISRNLRRLVTFTDMQSKRHWAYYAVMEAANGHSAVVDDTESWNRY